MKAVLATPALKRVGTLMGGTLLGQLAVFAVTPVLSRLYNAEAFSNFGIYIAISGIFAVIGTLRLEGAIPIADSDEDALHLTHAALSICAMMAVVSFIVTFTLSFSGLIRTTISPFSMSAFVAASTILIGFFQTLTAFQIRHDGFRQIAQAKASQGFILAASQVTLGLVSSGSISFILGDCLGRASGIASIAQKFLTDNSKRQPYQIKQLLYKYRQFPLFSAPASLINSLGLQAPVFILSATVNPAALGVFVFANRLIVVPLGVLAQSLAQVFIGEIGKAKNEKRSLQPIFIRYVLLALTATSVVVLPVLPFLNHIVPFIFGAKWVSSTKILSVLLLLSIIQIASVSVSQTLNAIGKNSWQLIWDISRLAAVYLTLISVLKHSKDINVAIAYSSVTNGIMYVILILISFLGIKSYQRSLNDTVAPNLNKEEIS